ncbi:hypothetical protein IWT25_02195 [Secundilactobacillus pentosiphilus]|uniref:Type II toxin-antitoxin system PemK/MazF family toxin n=1 Tax=Secundilactobacillus pentosiphilus TaxID=1714682 RepID=A0A1Z5IZ81_9LACO|nr:type II toxin-antitoxin system PemK/MazF family toxin [Secundilactobacillus pentosiphilus]GAX06848.1 hypothetical protein IWT25_02195 [Secundilactobacillus pentosiphilus]
MAGKNNHLSPSDKFNKANQNFKSVYYAGKNRENNGKPNKYHWLPEWTLSKSNYLLNERHASRNRKVYKRGSIVNVNFGVNVGEELSGNHFGIVLNRHDNKRNDKLTVIPLTSHEHTNTVKLDKTILNLSNSFFDQSITHRMLVILATYKIFYTPLKALEPETLSPEAFIDKSLKNLNHVLPEYTKMLKELVNQKLPDENSAIKFIQSDSPKDMQAKDFAEYLFSKDFFRKQGQLVNDLGFAYRKYEQYGKDTWAKISDIQTVSKSRLIRINSADPIGEIHVSPSVLDTIDKEIIRLFTHSE